MSPGRTGPPRRSQKSPPTRPGQPSPAAGQACLSPKVPGEGVLALGLFASACPWGWTRTSPKVPQTPFLLLHPSHDSVLRNVPGAKRKEQSHEMNTFPSLSSHSFPKRQGHLCLLPLTTQGLNLLRLHLPSIQPGLPPCRGPDSQAPSPGSMPPYQFEPQRYWTPLLALFTHTGDSLVKPQGAGQLGVVLTLPLLRPRLGPLIRAKSKGSSSPPSGPYQSLRECQTLPFGRKPQHLAARVAPGSRAHLGSSLEPPSSISWVKL